MKTILPIVVLALCVGCANSRGTTRIVSVKSTVWGIDVGTAPTGGMPAFKIGLVRSFWQEVPVSTNAIHAPDWRAEVDADVKLNHQKITEHFGAGRGATNSIP
jgi:hypothetical protein